MLGTLYTYVICIMGSPDYTSPMLPRYFGTGSGVKFLSSLHHTNMIVLYCIVILIVPNYRNTAASTSWSDLRGIATSPLILSWTIRGTQGVVV